MKTHNHILTAGRCLITAALGVLLLSSCHHKEAPEPELTPDQAVLVYMPWAGNNIYSYFIRNIAGLRQSLIDTKGGGRKRVMVLIADNDSRAHLIHLKYRNNDCVNDTIETFSYLNGQSFYSETGMADMFNRAKQSLPANSYALIIGCHGMGWLPIDARNDYAKPAFAPSQSGAAGTAASPAAGATWGGINLDGTYIDREIPTRFFGEGSDVSYMAEITTLAAAIRQSFGHTDYILFDDCHMMNIEVVYDLKDVTDYLIGSTSEVMIEGMPYDRVGKYLLSGDYGQVVEEFYAFYSAYRNPYGTLAVARSSEVDNLASVMRQVNAQHTLVPDSIVNVQKLDGFDPTVFYDMKSYVKRLCADDTSLFEQFEQQLQLTVPYARATDQYYSARSRRSYVIREFSGITISDPSWSYAARGKEQTAWWKATHDE